MCFSSRTVPHASFRCIYEGAHRNNVVHLGRSLHSSTQWQCVGYNRHLGTWEALNGLFPDYIYEVVKETLLQVEGLFRCFEGDLHRSELDLLHEIKRVFESKGIDTNAQIRSSLGEFIDNSIFKRVE